MPQVPRLHWPHKALKFSWYHLYITKRAVSGPWPCSHSASKVATSEKAGRKEAQPTTLLSPQQASCIVFDPGKHCCLGGTPTVQFKKEQLN